MSRGIFLNMKDSGFWGNDDPPDTRRQSGDEERDVWKERRDSLTPNRVMAMGERNPFQGDRGGFSRTNAEAYYEVDGDNSFEMPKNRNKGPRRTLLPLVRPSVTFEPNEPSRLLEDEPVAPIIPSFENKHLDPYVEKLCLEVSQGYELMADVGIPDELPVCRGNRHSVCVCHQSKWYEQHNPWPETYSRKVFVGGLPVDIKEKGPGGLCEMFSRFGQVLIDWPSKGETASPPKGYVFLVFEEEMAVHRLVEACIQEEERLFMRINHNERQLKIQVRPWCLADADYLVDVSTPVDPKNTIFIGGVPRPIRAVELAHLMERLYGSVLVAGIDIDVEFKYPKGTGAGRVVFESLDSYRKAVADRFAILGSGDGQRRVELKPYVLDNMACEECRNVHAPFFCPHLDCLQYYCEACWMKMHCGAKRENHTPLVKDA